MSNEKEKRIEDNQKLKCEIVLDSKTMMMEMNIHIIIAMIDSWSREAKLNDRHH